MGEPLLDKALELQRVAGDVQAVRNALQDAKRLTKRAEDLRGALTAPKLAADTWQMCADAEVSDLDVPDVVGLRQKVAELRERLDTSEPPPDTSFDDVKHGLHGLAGQISDTVARAWPSFAQSRADSAGLRSARVLPPARRRALRATITSVQQAVADPPTNPAQVTAFLRNLATLNREVSQARIGDLPAQLIPVFEKLSGSGAGVLLAELTVEQVTLLRDGGFADDLIVRWTE